LFLEKIEAELLGRTGKGGLCGAADVIACLSGLFRRRPEEGLLSAAASLGCGGTPELCPALAGARLFTGACADFAELPPEQARGLDGELLDRYRREAGPCGAGPGRGADPAACAARTAGLILLTRDLIREKLEDSLPPGKPRQYYDTIYADRSAMFRHTPYALEERLAGAVIRGDEPAALAALAEIGRSGEKAVLAADPLRSAKNSIIGTIAFLARASIQAGVDPEQVFALSDAITRRTEELGSRREVLASEERVLLRFMGLVKTRPDQGYSRPVRRALNYIESRLDRRLSLADIAGAARVNPSYLSGLFKQETGKSLRSFITLRKIQESTYFIRHTDYTVAEIAALYGFSGQSFFIRRFKEVTGKTPGEFRR
jgi:AraC-like DNA-binding protein